KLGLDKNSYKKIQAYLGEQVNINAQLTQHQLKKLSDGLESTLLQDELAEVETFQRNLFMLYFKQVGMDFEKGFLLVDGFSRGTVEALFNGMAAGSGIINNKSEWVYLELLDENSRNKSNSFLEPFKGRSSFSRIALAEALLATNEH